MKNIFKKESKESKKRTAEIRNEISLAIKKGMNNREADVQTAWNRLFPNGQEPTPEEFIKALASEIIKKALVYNQTSNFR